MKGDTKNSKYRKQFCRKSIELRPDLDDFLWFANEMIKVSMIFEEGKISKQQFEDKQRELLTCSLGKKKGEMRRSYAPRAGTLMVNRKQSDFSFTAGVCS